MKSSLLFIVAFAFVIFAVVNSLPTAYECSLNGANEVPVPTNSGAIGKGFIIFDPSNPSSLTATLYVNTVSGPTFGHIHNCSKSCAGPVYVNFTNNLPLFYSQTFTSGLISSLAFSDFLNQVIQNNTYFNIHSNSSPAGEIRGQLGLSPNFYISQLSSTNEVPGCNVSASGIATILIQDQLLFITVTSDVSSPTFMHIHIGPAGVAGPVAVNLTFFLPLPNNDIVVDLRVNGTISPGFNSSTVLAAIRSGNAYVNIHNAGCPSGAVRSQTLLQSAPSLIPASASPSAGSQNSASPSSGSQNSASPSPGSQNNSPSPSPQGGNGGGAASSLLSWLSFFQ